MDVSNTLLLLYGHQPSLRGNFLCNCFDRFLTQPPDEVQHEQLRLAVIDELIEWTQKYTTFMRRYIEVSPARRDLCFAPTEAKWKLILRQEAGIDRQIERKTRLLWEMQEVDRRRREDERWQEIAQQEAEVAQAREAEARAKASRARDKSHQVTENKEPASEEQGSGARETVGAPLVGVGQRPDETPRIPFRSRTSRPENRSPGSRIKVSPEVQSVFQFVSLSVSQFPGRTKEPRD